MSADWHPYPQTKPPAEGWYLVTMEGETSGRINVRSRFFDYDLQCFYYDNAGDRRVQAWAQLPEPFVGRNPYRPQPKKRDW